MQNRYVGDVGDYGKYALLRALCGPDTSAPVRLGVVWCLFPDETSNNDGKHISYLRNPQFAELDIDLHSALAAIVCEGRRSVSAICECTCLPPTMIYFSAPISGEVRAVERIKHRNKGLKACLRQTQECDVVFFDPDNGLEVASVPKGHPRAGKYLYWDELTPFWQRGNSLLIYHHLNRSIPAARQVEGLTSRFAREFCRAMIVPLVFRRGSSRVFWLVHQGDTLGLKLERRAADLLNGGWSRHYRPFGWPSNAQASTHAP